MGFEYYKIKITGSYSRMPDNLSEFVENYGYDKHKPEDMAKIANYFGMGDSYTPAASWDKIKEHLDSDNPVIIHGWFTSSGHIIILHGYDDSKGFLANDPNGEYPYTDFASGEDVWYSHEFLIKKCGDDGDLWAHYLENKIEKSSERFVLKTNKELITGIDVASDVTPEIECLKNKSYSFVGRYYNNNVPDKNLTRDEAISLSNNDLLIAAVWENGFPTEATYFSKTKGIFDGTSAYHYAQEIGQPAGSAIYFAVDFDATPKEVSGLIRDYFEGISEGFNNISSGNPVYDAGVYGSGFVCSWLSEKGLVKYTWQALSTGWLGYDPNGDWNIKQIQETTICGLDADTDLSLGDFGGFQI